MSIDKLKLKTTLRVKNSFWDEVNNIYSPVIYRTYRRPSINKTDPDYITIKCEEKGKEYFLQINYRIPKGGFASFIELNPAKIGFANVFNILKKIFNYYHIDSFSISRIDLCSDVEVPLEYVHNSLRVKYKRKTTTYRAKPIDEILHQDRILTGFYVGKSPSKLRIYDKKLELEKSKKNITDLPKNLTRFEYEYRHDKCPIRELSELSKLYDYNPFEKLEFNNTLSIDTEDKKGIVLQSLTEKFGYHSAVRRLNKNGHFNRDYGDIISEDIDLKEKLLSNYYKGINNLLTY